MKNHHLPHPGVVIHGPFKGGPYVRRWWRSLDLRLLGAIAFGGFWGFAFGYAVGVLPW